MDCQIAREGSGEGWWREGNGLTHVIMVKWNDGWIQEILKSPKNQLKGKRKITIPTAQCYCEFA